MWRGSPAAGEPGSWCLRGCRWVSGGHRRPPSRSPSCSSCRCICSRRPLRSPAHPAPAPQGRCFSCGLAPSLPVLLHSHPQLGLGRVRARTLGRWAVPRRRLRRAKCGWARATSSARPLAQEPACPPGGALLQETQRPSQRLQGCREPSCPERRRGQSSCLFCKAGSVLTRKWQCAEGWIREAGHRGPERPSAACWEEWWLLRQK